MAANLKICSVIFLAVVVLNAQETNGALSARTWRKIYNANRNGPYLGLVIPNLFEMNPLLQSPSFTSSNLTLDFDGRRFRFGTIGEKKVILTMTGLGVINAGITTQLLLSLFKIEGVVHCGIAGNANPSLNIGDVTIPRYWSHTGLWSWQRYGQGPNDELPLESDGDYPKKIAYMKFANYTVNATHVASYDNLLNNIWFEAEEVYPIDGTPEERQHTFWVAVDPHYFNISKKLEVLKLEGCINSTTCLSEIPKVTTVKRGTSASIFLDNAAYRSFVYNKFKVSPVDMESASVALICLQQKVPFIAIRALSDLAGGGLAQSNEANTFTSLAASNSAKVVVEFIKLLSA
ncbi:bark storage protein A-like [Juglans microcarpa x Juglans regia]|uniref:bark storage protein A-like n=1 Tax=Juglans microcarpa x Juglans regia TaxID=2249226 RepID=UPI001B7E9B01|nr:bark storage protein A-like [Juglans microcarpa x Juglans regia]